MTTSSDVGGDFEGDLAELSRRLRDGTTTSAKLTAAALERVEAANPHLNAVVTLLADGAMRDAEAADAELQAGHWRGPLHGIPFGVKDIFDTAGVRTTVGSEFFRDRVPDEDADVVRRVRDAGAVVIGKLHTHEFAFGPSGDASCFGPVRNPHDPGRMAGGSSGGSAVAVATGMCAAALGSDSGGSVRIPAALCGVVGMKPTYGRISRYGAFPLSWTLDHIGPLTRTVGDNARVLGVLCGYDDRDPDSLRRDDEDFTRELDFGVRGLTVGVPDGYYFDHLDPEVDRLVRAAIGTLADLGATVRPVSLPGLPGLPDLAALRDAHRTVISVEAYAIHRERLDASPELFDPIVRQRLLDGSAIEGWEYAEALRLLGESRRTFTRLMAAGGVNGVDALATPSVAVTAPRLGQVDTDAAGVEETVRWALTRLAVPTNVTGTPSLSVPCGLSRDGLPVGLQLSGPAWSEARLYRIGRALETGLGRAPGSG
ncbi:aspartyl-tRNA(Asn)/glutamyl-tRNA(Gln) amidotransferase subunit A [Actinopolymorpha cephalotaxi]|uniref:Aspartyl-tRNA(Asn)/glutamyl-tRNA(Gln) amidotransferase subunit A n=1 Tax=Actinopolymorpha cephalotaxi TaxID=504797 RepID=A0A1I3C763_9ACTN|nr:amidase [Actinopolymorpha cephalotaxi]NYH86834.1 aspartyl-tRNA(Asn)/glutamyl-tRNA(Gln) amidotransferase subunit A [Actinopolymorpha cephalotaxi]SFH70357.1 aspartyl-tRNA(Asn)/glutamyl-tRNA(Gln) amidotransferase subunit A [Actinopolymorpha cephalotaxi]